MIRFQSFSHCRLSVRVATLTLVGTAAVQAQTPAAELSLDSLLNTPVSAASKYEQRVSQAPASVTILTAEEITRFGYRNLQEALESVRGFYVTDDHNYPYLGVRGFSRPSDYNNRILLLVNGQSVNEYVWGGAPIGTDLPLNMEAIERIEIVRGPGSVLYGTNAMFGVVNVVMKTAAHLRGISVTAGAGPTSRHAGVTVGAIAAEDLNFSASLQLARDDGETFYFAEYDDPSTSFGVANGLDWERATGGHGKLTWRGLSLAGGMRARSKGIPTGAYSTAFADERMRTVDENQWAELSYERQMNASLRATGRIFADFYQYYGTYPYDNGPTYNDEGFSDAGGLELLAVWDQTSRSRFTFGGEHRRVARAEYVTIEEDGTRANQDAPFLVSSLFAQHELSFSRKVSFLSGVRMDARSGLHRALTPRAALVVAPDERTSVKLLYGEAFRAPTPSERDYDFGYYMANRSLRPERIRTIEVEAQRRVASPLLLTASAYQYSTRDLIEQTETGVDLVQFQNLSAAHAVGSEFEADVRPAGPLAARFPSRCRTCGNKRPTRG